mgnify:CR=1 FL=1
MAIFRGQGPGKDTRGNAPGSKWSAWNAVVEYQQHHAPVRVRGDETLVTDGPFAELKETLGGYYVFECDSIDEACAWAAKIPAARHGAIEVRPVHVDPEGEEQS